MLSAAILLLCLLVGNFSRGVWTVGKIKTELRSSVQSLNAFWFLGEKSSAFRCVKIWNNAVWNTTNKKRCIVTFVYFRTSMYFVSCCKHLSAKHFVLVSHNCFQALFFPFLTWSTLVFHSKDQIIQNFLIDDLIGTTNRSSDGSVPSYRSQSSRWKN